MAGLFTHLRIWNGTKSLLMTGHDAWEDTND
jgi:hypothetical protein